MPKERKYGLDITIVVRHALKDAYARGEKAALDRTKNSEHRMVKLIFEKFIDPIIKGRLTPREEEIIRERFVDFLGLEEVGKKHGITRERVRQIEARVLYKIEHLPDAFREEGRQMILQELGDKNMSDPNIQKLIEKRKKEIYTPIEILNFCPRTLNALINAGVGSIEQLVDQSEGTLSNFRGFGGKALDEVKLTLAQRGMRLRGDNEQVEKKEPEIHYLDEFKFYPDTLKTLLRSGLDSIEAIVDCTPDELTQRIGKLNADYVQLKIFEVGKWHLRNPEPLDREDMRFPIPASDAFDGLPSSSNE